MENKSAESSQQLPNQNRKGKKIIQDLLENESQSLFEVPENLQEAMHEYLFGNFGQMTSFRREISKKLFVKSYSELLKKAFERVKTEKETRKLTIKAVLVSKYIISLILDLPSVQNSHLEKTEPFSHHLSQFLLQQLLQSKRGEIQQLEMNKTRKKIKGVIDSITKGTEKYDKGTVNYAPKHWIFTIEQLEPKDDFIIGFESGIGPDLRSSDAIEPKNEKEAKKTAENSQEKGVFARMKVEYNRPSVKVVKWNKRTSSIDSFTEIDIYSHTNLHYASMLDEAETDQKVTNPMDKDDPNCKVYRKKILEQETRMPILNCSCVVYPDALNIEDILAFKNTIEFKVKLLEGWLKSEKTKETNNQVAELILDAFILEILESEPRGTGVKMAFKEFINKMEPVEIGKWYNKQWDEAIKNFKKYSSEFF